ncbi:MAG: hypothetical protein H6816_04210 [Phycisphaerales bacterium]|nr:hypothetical protein [Phycisphaerales bacterium]
MNEMSGLCATGWGRRGRWSAAASARRAYRPGVSLPGVGYGGSCFPKDVQGLMSAARPDILQAVHHRGGPRGQLPARRRLRRACCAYGDGRRAVLAVWGLAFKARTDDVREAPAIDWIRMFLDQGIRVRAHDPEGPRRRPAPCSVTRSELFEDGYAPRRRRRPGDLHRLAGVPHAGLHHDQKAASISR